MKNLLHKYNDILNLKKRFIFEVGNRGESIQEKTKTKKNNTETEKPADKQIKENDRITKTTADKAIEEKISKLGILGILNKEDTINSILMENDQIIDNYKNQPLNVQMAQNFAKEGDFENATTALQNPDKLGQIIKSKKILSKIEDKLSIMVEKGTLEINDMNKILLGLKGNMESAKYSNLLKKIDTKIKNIYIKSGHTKRNLKSINRAINIIKRETVDPKGMRMAKIKANKIINNFKNSEMAGRELKKETPVQEKAEK